MLSREKQATPRFLRAAGLKKTTDTKIVKLDFGNQLGFDFEGRGFFLPDV